MAEERAERTRSREAEIAETAETAETEETGEARETGAAEPTGSTPTPPESLRAALEAIAEHKGEDIVVLDMREVTSFTDWLVVCNGRNPRQNQAIADAVAESVRDHDRKPNSVEGRSEGTWILADYVDFVVNIFAPETREFYQLERLWRDAPAYEPDDDGLVALRRRA